MIGDTTWLFHGHALRWIFIVQQATHMVIKENYPALIFRDFIATLICSISSWMPLSALLGKNIYRHSTWTFLTLSPSFSEQEEKHPWSTNCWILLKLCFQKLQYNYQLYSQTKATHWLIVRWILDTALYVLNHYIQYFLMKFKSVTELLHPHRHCPSLTYSFLFVSISCSFLESFCTFYTMY